MSPANLDKKAIAKTFKRVGTLMELAGEEDFKATAYTRASRAIETFEGAAEDIVPAAKAGKIRGIGKGLTDSLVTLVETGELPELESLEASFPPGYTDMLAISGLGAKSVRKLNAELSIQNLDQLEAACRDGSIAAVSGFGEKKREKILEGIEHLRQYAGQYHQDTALRDVDALIAALAPSVEKISAAGDVRRCMETVREARVLVAATDEQALAAALKDSDLIRDLKGPSPSSHRMTLPSGMPCEVRVVPKNHWGWALALATGSDKHLADLAAHAASKGMQLNGDARSDGKVLDCDSEEAFFNLLGLSYIPPEIREGDGEIDAAAAGKIPTLLAQDDLVGIIHNHTQYSDGTGSLAQMAEASRALGYRYFAVSDHSKSSTVAGGLSVDEIKKQHKEIDAWNAEHPDMPILKGIECDILKDGKLDYEDDVLATFDYVIVSVHSHFTLSEQEMTDRVIRAVRNPHVTMLAHPTGRLLLRREPYAIDMAKVIDACAECGCAIEVNANPYRLDIDWRLLKGALSAGIKTAISPDAHSDKQLAFARYGVNIARKGWATPADVLNCLSADDLKAFTAKQRG
ncbi:MAG: DNA polymerase/3'-5' exonuclease PolX [Deltaproteobacteria bacterium]|nr:DNA polymerase/3'-5' exonuclease PolX [Deltaproteobacteria bacterium]MCB9488535.1 DNA polymerase/3'-5' exonuclease PolX [Deltaproteobacteria bacterium]